MSKDIRINPEKFIRTDPELKPYGWGFLDKNGPTKYFISADNESLLAYKVALLNREKPDDAPFRVVPLFYKEEGE